MIMKNKIEMKSFLLGALLAATVVIAVAAGKESTGKAWQYDVKTLELVPYKYYGSSLHELTKDGWEIVSTSVINIEPGAGGRADVSVLLRRPQPTP
jgi:hypothetical protein